MILNWISTFLLELFLDDVLEVPRVILSFMKFCVARTFLVEIHQDDVLEVLLVVGLFDL